MPDSAVAALDWPAQIYDVLRAFEVRQVAHVPDAGHARLIRLCEADQGMRTVSLTTEEEGIALLTGAHLGGQRGVLLMQSSGVGNTINMLSLVKHCRVPFLTIVTMRGEWGEFNPWQVPMGAATERSLELMGVRCMRVETAADVEDTVSSAATLAYEADQQIAVILSQRMLGRKKWVEK